MESESFLPSAFPRLLAYFFPRWQVKDTLYNLGSNRINDKRLLIRRNTVIPIGMEPLQRLPSFIRASKTERILLLVSLAYHSFIMFKNGAKSLSEDLSLSMLLLIARKWTFSAGIGFPYKSRPANSFVLSGSCP